MSPSNTAPKCFCGNDAIPTRSNTYCSRLCAVTDAAEALTGSPSHYRLAQLSKIRVRERKNHQLRRVAVIDCPPSLTPDSSEPASSCDTTRSIAPFLYESSSEYGAGFGMTRPPSSRTPPGASRSKIPILKKLFKTGINPRR